MCRMWNVNAKTMSWWNPWFLTMPLFLLSGHRLWSVGTYRTAPTVQCLPHISDTCNRCRKRCQRRLRQPPLPCSDFLPLFYSDRLSDASTLLPPAGDVSWDLGRHLEWLQCLLEQSKRGCSGNVLLSFKDCLGGLCFVVKFSCQKPCLHDYTNCKKKYLFVFPQFKSVDSNHKMIHIALILFSNIL